MESKVWSQLQLDRRDAHFRALTAHGMDFPGEPPLELRVNFDPALELIFTDFKPLVDLVDLGFKSLVNRFDHDFLVFFVQVFLHGCRPTVNVSAHFLNRSVELAMEINMEHRAKVLRVNCHSALPLQHFLFGRILLNVVQHESMDGLMERRML